MYFKQNNAIQSTDRKVLNCHTIEFSFKAQGSIIEQRCTSKWWSPVTHCRRHRLTHELEACHWNMVGFSVGSKRGSCLLAGKSDLNVLE